MNKHLSLLYLKPRQVAGFFVYRHLGLAWCNIGYMKRFLPLLIILPLLIWVACEDAENEAENQLCTSEVEAMNAASEALENAEGVAEIAAAILTACESIDETIQCMSESSLFTQEDVDEMQASYDEICGG